MGVMTHTGRCHCGKVRFGGDATGQSNGRYRFVHNTVVLAAGSAGVFRLFDFERLTSNTHSRFGSSIVTSACAFFLNEPRSLSPKMRAGFAAHISTTRSRSINPLCTRSNARPTAVSNPVIPNAA